MKHMGCDGSRCGVYSRNSRSLEKYEQVTIVGHEIGINPKATKWRTGADVTENQRKKYPQYVEIGINDVKEKEMEQLTVEEVQSACRVFETIRNSAGIRSVGLSIEGNIYYHLEGGYNQQVSVEPNTWRIEELLKFVNEDPRKVALQKSLDELLAKAEEIKTQIKEL
jgi:hypothetical protein